MDLIKPKALRPGDTIGILSPSSATPDAGRIDLAIERLTREGYRVALAQNARKRHAHMGGTDAERVADIHELFGRDDVHAVFCARGGDSAPRLLGDIDYGLIRAHPKVFVGYSDITSLHLAFFKRAGLVTFHGPSLVNLRSPETRESLRRALMTTEPAGAIRRLDDPAPTATFRGGTATGKLIGGSMAAIVGLNGTPHALRPQNTLLFLDESEQRFSQFDRDLTTLRLSGITTAANGIAIGECAGAFNSSPTFQSLEEIFAEQLERVRAPSFYGLPIGQGRVQHTLPIGVHAALDADAGLLEIAESGVAE